jgi:replicative DNA helicase
LASPECNLLSHILKTGDMVGPLAAEVEKSIALFRDEWDFIKSYYTENGLTPPISVFEDKFSDFIVVNTEATMEFYIKEVHEHRAKRDVGILLQESAMSLKEKGPFPVIGKLTSELARLGRATRMVRDFDLVNNADDRLEAFRQRLELRKSGVEVLGVPSGIKAIDQSFGGYQKGDFIVIAGWTGSLKSYFVLLQALNAWRQNKRVLYFSLEMSAEQLGYRMDTLLGEGQFSHTDLSFGLNNVSYDYYKKWQRDTYHGKEPFIIVSNEDLEEVTQDTVRAKIDQWHPDIVVLDYLQLFDEASGITGETEKVKQLSKAFKRIAIKTATPIIVITSVTQDKKDLGEQLPELADLAWSKQLAYDSDLTMTLMFSGEALEVASKKNRRGKPFHFFIRWDVEHGKVEELSGAFNKFNRRHSEDDEADMDDN